MLIYQGPLLHLLLSLITIVVPSGSVDILNRFQKEEIGGSINIHQR